MSLIPPTISITNCTDGLKVNVDASNQISISPQSIEFSCDNNMFTALVAETPKDITNIAYLNILEKTQITSSVQIGDDTTGASSINAGAIRYRSDSNNSYCEMVMQTGSTEYGWVIIKQNTW